VGQAFLPAAAFQAALWLRLCCQVGQAVPPVSGSLYILLGELAGLGGAGSRPAQRPRPLSGQVGTVGNLPESSADFFDVMYAPHSRAPGSVFAILWRLEESMSTVVLITGASTGFGRAAAETMARRGYTVFATMRDCSGSNAANCEALQSLAGRERLALHVLDLDVTHEASVDQAIQDALSRAGPYRRSDQ
jgi:hypothetical protein